MFCLAQMLYFFALPPLKSESIIYPDLSFCYFYFFSTYLSLSEYLSKYLSLFNAPSKKQFSPPCLSPAKKRLGGLKTSQLLFLEQKSKSISPPFRSLQRTIFPALSFSHKERDRAGKNVFWFFPKGILSLFWNQKTKYFSFSFLSFFSLSLALSLRLSLQKNNWEVFRPPNCFFGERAEEGVCFRFFAKESRYFVFLGEKKLRSFHGRREN